MTLHLIRPPVVRLGAVDVQVGGARPGWAVPLLREEDRYQILTASPEHRPPMSTRCAS